MGILDRVMRGLDKAEAGLDKANAGLGNVNKSLQRRVDAVPPKRRVLQEVRGPVGWLHRHDVAARLIFLAAFAAFAVIGGALVGNAPDAVVAATLALAAICLLLVVWFALYGGDWF